MSAFVVDPKTINRVLTFFSRSRSDLKDQIKRELAKIEWDLETEENRQDLGQAMYNLNINAVSQRYPNCDESNMPGSISTQTGSLIRFRLKVEPCTKHQAFKSLQCWHYQCSEGDCPKLSRLYKAFDRILSILAFSIIYDLPQYDSADWG